ncbi:hypothetical protein BURPS1710b_0281 [Burkholderia pseudomallei 1710b]|uniref:Uncharacterized protein n=1 Tax=Burkholderia pseudomallei (strain 1710b) TaxID=320372 RepID=Q3JXK7_BURP1|nr:hypothetical protein BURPS1710b_0281 [Burkholderia pseudomallei 1710b]
MAASDASSQPREISWHCCFTEQKKGARYSPERPCPFEGKTRPSRGTSVRPLPLELRRYRIDPPPHVPPERAPRDPRQPDAHEQPDDPDRQHREPVAERDAAEREPGRCGNAHVLLAVVDGDPAADDRYRILAVRHRQVHAAAAIRRHLHVAARDAGHVHARHRSARVRHRHLVAVRALQIERDHVGARDAERVVLARREQLARAITRRVDRQLAALLARIDHALARDDRHAAAVVQVEHVALALDTQLLRVVQRIGGRGARALRILRDLAGLRGLAVRRALAVRLARSAGRAELRRAAAERQDARHGRAEHVVTAERDERDEARHRQRAEEHVAQRQHEHVQQERHEQDQVQQPEARDRADHAHQIAERAPLLPLAEIRLRLQLARELLRFTERGDHVFLGAPGRERVADVLAVIGDDLVDVPFRQAAERLPQPLDECVLLHCRSSPSARVPCNASTPLTSSTKLRHSSSICRRLARPASVIE